MSESIDDYVKRMIKDGYRDEEDFEPIKCTNCESMKIYYANEVYDSSIHMTVEFDAVCVNCDKTLGHWAYGGWGL